MGGCTVLGVGRSQVCVFSLIASPPTPRVCFFICEVRNAVSVLHSPWDYLENNEKEGLWDDDGDEADFVLGPRWDLFCPQLFFLIFIFFNLFGCLGLSWGIWDLVP